MVVLIWRGFGPVVPLLWVPGFLVSIVFKNDPKVGVLAAGVCYLVAGALLIFIGRRLNRRRWEHSLFFVPVQFWGIATAGFGLFLIAMRFVTPLWDEFVGPGYS